METIERLVNSLGDAMEFNKATLSGCVDIVVVRQPDGSLKSTPFHVRFGKLKLLKSKNCSVDISINSIPTGIKMRLGDAGEGFFQQENITDNTQREQQNLNKALAEKLVNIESNLTVKKSSKELDLKTSLNICDLKTRASSQYCENKNENVENEDVANEAGDLIFLDDIELEEPESQKASSALSMNIQRACSAPNHEELKHKKINSKTLRPSSAQLESLNLKSGINTITYSVKSNLQGEQKINGNIYLWSYDSNIIISDIDGTITKTDVMGHLMSMVGKDWSQPGIAPLYTNIKRNGYHILYLTSRAIGQAKQTRDFLNSVQQDGKMLPRGPLILSPDRMLPSVKRELIYKRPDLFKSAVLKDIRSLFPAQHNPFHAGFGNRETDAIAYKSVGIPLEKVFIVNPKGDIHHHGHEKGIAKSYAVINSMIKDHFPGILKSSKTKLAEKLRDENALNLKDANLMQSNLVKVVS